VPRRAEDESGLLIFLWSREQIQGSSISNRERPFLGSRASKSPQFGLVVAFYNVANQMGRFTSCLESAPIPLYRGRSPARFFFLGRRDWNPGALCGSFNDPDDLPPLFATTIPNRREERPCPIAR